MIIIAIVVIIACIRAMIGVCVCVRKFATVTTMVAHEVSLDRPSLSNSGDPEDPENPENEEPSVKSSGETMTVGFYEKYESVDTHAFGTDKTLLKEFNNCC